MALNRFPQPIVKKKELPPLEMGEIKELHNQCVAKGGSFSYRRNDTGGVDMSCNVPEPKERAREYDE